MIADFRARFTRLTRLAGRVVNMVLDPTVFGLMVAAAVLGRQGQRIRRVVEVPGAASATAGNRVCLYSHFDRDSLVAPHVLQALAAVSRLGFRIHFITTSRHLHPEVVEAVSPFCEKIIHKDNHGLDFGAWRLGWRLLGRETPLDELLLLNDSVYGPLADLGAVFDRMAGEPCDFWSITDSWDQKYHLQSYFLVFRRAVLASAAFEGFWDSFWLINHKNHIVRRCEIGLTQRLLKAGFAPKAFCAYLDVRDHVVRRLLDRSESPGHLDGVISLPHGRVSLAATASADMRAHLLAEGALIDATLNPMHHFWKVLITDFGCPYLKADLLLRNPVKIVDAYQWKQLVSQHTTYDPSLIERHLYRLARRRVP